MSADHTPTYIDDDDQGRWFASCGCEWLSEPLECREDAERARDEHLIEVGA